VRVGVVSLGLSLAFAPASLAPHLLAPKGAAKVRVFGGVDGSKWHMEPFRQSTQGQAPAAPIDLTD
jgi:hypothetical protein